MKKPDVNRALTGLSMVHNEVKALSKKDPSIANKCLLLLVEAVMNDLGYNITIKYETLRRLQ